MYQSKHVNKKNKEFDCPNNSLNESIINFVLNNNSFIKEKILIRKKRKKKISQKEQIPYKMIKYQSYKIILHSLIFNHSKNMAFQKLWAEYLTSAQINSVIFED